MGTLDDPEEAAESAARADVEPMPAGAVPAISMRNVWMHFPAPSSSSSSSSCSCKKGANAVHSLHQSTSPSACASLETERAITCKLLRLACGAQEPQVVRAVNGMELALYEGQMTCLLGPNGAGKSTLLELLMGLAAPTRGDIRVFGRVRAHSYPRVHAFTFTQCM